jgi:type IV pilus assembly protein PilA
MNRKNNQGFTLIELLIVVAIIAIIAGIIFVALNPLKRFQDSRDARRISDIETLLAAIKTNQVDRGGSYIDEIELLTDGEVNMIGTDTTGCDLTCTTAVTSSNNCVDLTPLADSGYFGTVPISPNGVNTSAWTAEKTGYTLTKASNGIINIRACEYEGPVEISMSR